MWWGCGGASRLVIIFRKWFIRLFCGCFNFAKDWNMRPDTETKSKTSPLAAIIYCTGWINWNTTKQCCCFKRNLQDQYDCLKMFMNSGQSHSGFLFCILCVRVCPSLRQSICMPLLRSSVCWSNNAHVHLPINMWTSWRWTVCL